MLNPDYFVGKEEKILAVYESLEDWLFNDIAMRLVEAEEMSGTADREIQKLKLLGKRNEEILQRLSKLTGMTEKELREILQDAVLTSWKTDKPIMEEIGMYSDNPLKNPVFVKVIDAEFRKGAKELENLTRTTMLQTNKDLIQLLDEVEIRVASGIQSYSSAICDVLDGYAGKGVSVDYAGRRMSVESAVRMCVVTSMNQTSAQLTNAYIVEGQCDYVLVSAHLGARHTEGASHIANHDEWQGQVYKIHGSDEHARNLLQSTGYDIDENGNGIVKNPLGLHGYNCRHSHQPWDIKLKNPYIDENGKLKIDTKKSRELYEKQQKQRAMERGIRKTKRMIGMKQAEINLITDKELKDKLNADLKRLKDRGKEQAKKYTEFCQINDLETQSIRLKLVK